MEEIIANVNWIAVAAGTIVSFLVGWFWYSPTLFGTKWLEGVGVSADDNSPMMHAMIAQLLGTFLLAWVIAVTAVTDSLLLAILIAFTIAVIVKANGLFSQKSMYAIRTEVGFIIVMVVIMIGVHAVV